MLTQIVRHAAYAGAAGVNASVPYLVSNSANWTTPLNHISTGCIVGPECPRPNLTSPVVTIELGIERLARPAPLPLRQPQLLTTPMSVQDIPTAAAMAVDLLPASLLAQLGVSFMSALYAAALQHPATIALKATRDGETVGFCLASADVDGFKHAVRPEILPATVRALLSPGRLKLIPSFLRSLAEPEPQPHIPAELLLLYVDQSRQRRGIGRALVTQLEAAFEGVGAHHYRVAVRKQLSSACAFYLASGFIFEQERTVLGHPMAYFVHDL